MTGNEKYEIVAEAFRLMTGHMAPGKDASPESYPAPLEERSIAYDIWLEAHRRCINSMLLSFERIMEIEDEATS